VSGVISGVIPGAIPVASLVSVRGTTGSVAGAAIAESAAAVLSSGSGAVCGIGSASATHSPPHRAHRVRVGSRIAISGGNWYCAAQIGQVIRMSHRMTFSLAPCNQSRRVLA
jgi:hypothetical protein